MGLQDRPLITGVGTIVTDADMDFPLVVAVITTAVLALAELAVAGKLAVVVPAATVTLVGTARAALSSDTVMT